MRSLAIRFCAGIFVISIVKISACGRDENRTDSSDCRHRCTTTTRNTTTTTTAVPRLNEVTIVSMTTPLARRKLNTTANTSSVEQTKEICPLGCIAFLIAISAGCVLATIIGTVVSCILRGKKMVSSKETPDISVIDHVGYYSVQPRNVEIDDAYTTLRYYDDIKLQITENDDTPAYCSIIG